MSAHSMELDTDLLSNYLSAHLPGFEGPLNAEKFAGGQSNPTYLLTAASGEYVLRRKPPGKLLPSAHAVDREYAVLSALKDSDVPVATPMLLCEDDSIIGSMFYIMSFEKGRIFWDPALKELGKTDRAPIYNEIIRVLAALHSVDVAEVGLADYGKPGNYFERQYDRWVKQYRAAEVDKIDEIEQLIDWLGRNLPEDDGTVSLIHGDYRLDNFIFKPDASEIIAVLDWELSTLGHPMADLGYICMCLRLPSMGEVRGLLGVDRSELGIPSEEELIAQYCQLRGIDRIENWHFYLAFAYFRLAAIVQGVYKRALGGNASNTKALALGKAVQPLAMLALGVIAAPTQA
ncbi:MAG: phosphotransferase family protein [Mangrovicoccus sp.]|nr:phosphotransferase family protein [Mangrovicoccus sp.]